MIFSEESKRIVHELGNSELYDFGKKVQHHPTLQTYAGRTKILYMRNVPPTRRRYN